MSQEDDTMDPGRFCHRLLTICLVHQGGRLLSMSDWCGVPSAGRTGLGTLLGIFTKHCMRLQIACRHRMDPPSDRH